MKQIAITGAVVAGFLLLGSCSYAIKAYLKLIYVFIF